MSTLHVSYVPSLYTGFVQLPTLGVRVLDVLCLDKSRCQS